MKGLSSDRMERVPQCKLVALRHICSGFVDVNVKYSLMICVCVCVCVSEILLVDIVLRACGYKKNNNN